EVRDREGRWYMMRVNPYRTADHKIDGAVMVLVDVSEIHRTQEELEQRTAQLSRQAQLIELSHDAIVVRDAHNVVLFWNRGAQAMSGWTADGARGKPLDQLVRPEPAAWAELNSVLDRDGAWEGELRQSRRDGAPVIVHSREVLVRDQTGARSAVLAIKRDVT